jgi:hypothetical protein
LLKEPKYYFYDTGAVENQGGARLENAVACCLLAELHFHQDTTGDRVDLHYLRDKDKNEVDFLTVVNKTPVNLVEVKSGDEKFSRSLFHFKQYFSDVSCFQLVMDLTRKKSTPNIRLLPAHEFLADISFSSAMEKKDD